MWYGAYVVRLTAPEMSERHAHIMAWAPAPLVIAAFMAFACFNASLAVASHLVIVSLYLLPTPAWWRWRIGGQGSGQAPQVVTPAGEHWE